MCCPTPYSSCNVGLLGAGQPKHPSPSHACTSNDWFLGSPSCLSWRRAHLTETVCHVSWYTAFCYQLIFLSGVRRNVYETTPNDVLAEQVDVAR